ncbi:MAG: DNA polymerase III subunit gamma/tau [Rikenellaceae bacterium]
MENFIVSARKYRPITFESVVGQNHITSTLKNAISRNQTAHAYLFCGPRGVGKTTCARILSKTLNCLNLNDSIEPCGECESCKAFDENRSFNIHELDAASNNSVENIRALNDQVRIPPQVGKYGIYIIDEAHMLSTAAFNAFLKTLEEPPSHAIFILATTEKHKILPTILSRCQSYDFKRIRVEDMAQYLKFISTKEGINFDEESLHIISQKADGCMRDALSMYDKVVSFCGSDLKHSDVSEALNILDYDSYFQFVDAYKQGDYKDALLQLDSILQKGFDVTSFLGGLSNHLRNLLVAADPATLPLLEVTSGIAERFKAQTSTMAISLIFDSLNIISQAESATKFSLNIRLLAELTILKLCNLSPIKLTGGSINQTYTLPPISNPSPQSAPIPQSTTTPTNTQSSNCSVNQEVKVETKSSEKTVVKSANPVVQAAEKPAVTTTSVPTAPPLSASEPTPIKQPNSATAPRGEKRSLLGVSISSLTKATASAKDESESEQVSCKDNDTDYSAVIPASKETNVLSGCKLYAEELKNSRPRLAGSFEYCTIKDGRLIITVANHILSDEINTNRHSITERLMELCSLRPLFFDIVVDEKIESDKPLLLRDEDKLKFMIEKNSSMSKLCTALNLDYV